MGIKIIEPTWTQWETFAARPNVSKYYIQHASTYEPIAVDLHFVYHCKLNVASEITDFETNHKSGSTAVTNLGDAIGLAFKIETLKVSRTTADNAVDNPIFTQPTDGTDAFGVTENPFFVNNKDGSGNNLTSTAGGASSRLLDIIVRDMFCLSSDHLITFGTIVSSSTAANQTILTYTVPAGKDLLLTNFFVTKGATNAVDASPFRLRVNDTDIMTYATDSTARYWMPPFSFPIRIATAAQVVTITVTPGGTTTTTWNATLMGYLRSI